MDLLRIQELKVACFEPETGDVNAALEIIADEEVGHLGHFDTRAPRLTCYQSE